MNELALFAGAGGGLLGSRLLGWRTVCAVEINEYCRRVLLQRQRDGLLDLFPIWDDVRSFDGRPWRGCVDIITGGFPCQDISAAGKGAGIDGPQSGLWREFARIICEVRPAVVFVENSPILTVRGLDRVLGDLAAMGFDARWGVLYASDAAWSCGTPAVYHDRGRIWIVGEGADARSAERRPLSVETCDLAPDACLRLYREETTGRHRDLRESVCEWEGGKIKTVWWLTEPSVGRVAYGVAHRVDRLRAIGNGQVPAVVALAWKLLSLACINDRSEFVT